VTTPHQRILDLLALAADQNTEEGRTAAHAAAKLIAKHGLPSPATAGPMPAANVRYETKTERTAGHPTHMPPTAWDKKKKNLLAIVADEAVQLLRTIDVLPHAIPIYGLQMVPAERRGMCSCAHVYKRGEMVSREPRPRCARCVSARPARAF